MKLNELKPPKGAVKKGKRLGRGAGSGRGKTCTHGHKGQNSRSGGGVPPWFEGGQMPLQRRLPKRGFHNKFKKCYQIINLDDLKDFNTGSKVNGEVLAEAGLINKASSPVKVLGNGAVEVALEVKVDKISKSAARAIQKAGGSVKLVSGDKVPGLDDGENTQ
ncbi:MAG TPA: 50S ribosomal protein L15 [Candidatus Krumholzibacteriaceae bacterium]|nr:50S ribosomal protein L15 [Candidatus Krumholzibacteriaceae bacterium]